MILVLTFEQRVDDWIFFWSEYIPPERQHLIRNIHAVSMNCARQYSICIANSKVFIMIFTKGLWTDRSK